MSSLGIWRVYPRVCGGTDILVFLNMHGGGLSPRVRGNPADAIAEEEALRSIPACAGEPGDGRVRVPIKGVYPRVCGGTASTLQGQLPP